MSKSKVFLQKEINLLNQNKKYNIIISHTSTRGKGKTMFTRSRYSWGNTAKSEHQQTMMNSFIQSLNFDDRSDKCFVNRELEQIDKTLSRILASENYDPSIINDEIQPYFTGTKKLSLPKSSTLTDSLIRNSLGCDQKYAKSYVQLLESTRQDTQKQRRIEDIKRRFSETNKFIDVFANTKPHNTQQNQRKYRPVVDNQHEDYLKTQLIFLQKPNNSKYTQKQYFEKHIDQVTKKIQELGGMEDTIGKMERSLTSNEIKSLKKKQSLKELSTSPKKNSYLLPQKSKTSSMITGEKNWINRSRLMRQNFKSKIQFS